MDKKVTDNSADTQDENLAVSENDVNTEKDALIDTQDGTVVVRENDSKEIDLAQDPEVFVKNELDKLTEKMALLKDSLNTIKNLKQMTASLQSK